MSDRTEEQRYKMALELVIDDLKAATSYLLTEHADRQDALDMLDHVCESVDAIIEELGNTLYIDGHEYQKEFT